MRIMTSKYPGTCKVCGKAFGAGTPIAWYGRGLAVHVIAECRPADTELQERAEELKKVLDLIEGN